MTEEGEGEGGGGGERGEERRLVMLSVITAERGTAKLLPVSNSR